MFEPWKWETLQLVASTPAEFVKQHLRDRQVAGLNATLNELKKEIRNQNAAIGRIEANSNASLISKLKKKARTALFILKHEGISGIMRAVREKLSR